MMTNYRDDARRLIKQCGEHGPIMVHVDLLGASVFSPPEHEFETYCRKHREFMCILAGKRPLWIPAFNYSFLSTRKGSVALPPQVGPFPLYLYREGVNRRTHDPVFSVFVLNDDLPTRDIFTGAFNQNSIFQLLLEQDGVIMSYGGPLDYTFVHYIEWFSGKLLYRYNKLFSGVYNTGTEKVDVLYEMHCRPKDCSLGYDWERIGHDLDSDGVARSICQDNVRLFSVVRCSELLEYLLKRLSQDPFYLLNEKSRNWVIPLSEKLGRPFTIADFE